MAQGVTFVSTGEQYVHEAAESAGFVLESNPKVPICVITSESLENIARQYDVFQDIVTVADSKIFDDIRDKAYHMDRTSYSKTLYLDTDTVVMGDLTPVFEALNRFDILARHAPYKTVELSDVPDAFPELNGGVIAFRSCDRVDEMFDIWIDKYEQQIKHGRVGDIPIKSKDKLSDLGGGGQLHDQSSFREAIYISDVQFAALPNNYNFRHSGRVHGKVKILHEGGGEMTQRLIKVINESPYGRTYVRSVGKLFYEDGSSVTLISPVEKMIEETVKPQMKSILSATGMLPIAKRVYQKLIRE